MPRSSVDLLNLEQEAKASKNLFMLYIKPISSQSAPSAPPDPVPDFHQALNLYVAWAPIMGLSDLGNSGWLIYSMSKDFLGAIWMKGADLGCNCGYLFPWRSRNGSQSLLGSTLPCYFEELVLD